MPLSDEAPEGYRWVWVQAGPEWKIADLDRRCRYKHCEKRAVAALLRKQRNGARWWFYCEDHMYGRRIEDGVVQTRQLVPEDFTA